MNVAQPGQIAISANTHRLTDGYFSFEDLGEFQVKGFLALSSPGGDTQDQQALQVFLNIAVFGMRPQRAIEAPRFNSLHHEWSFGRHGFGDKEGRAGVLQVEDRMPSGVVEALRHLGHRVEILGPFSMDTGTVLAGVDPTYGTLFGAADVRRERFVLGW